MDFKTLQKLRFFLASAFPVLTRLPPMSAMAHAWLEQHPRLKALLTQVRESKLAASARRVSGMLVVGDYEGDRIDDKIIPAETLGVLRSAVVLAVALCLLVPLALLVIWPALSLEQTGAARVLVPLGLIFLLAATAIGWSDVILLQPGRAWLPGLEAAAERITGLTPWLWRQPLWGMTMEWMRGAFAIVLGLAVWAAVRRRLNGEVMAMLLCSTALLWLAIAQYFFEFSSFG